MLFERLPAGQVLPRQLSGAGSKLGGQPHWEQGDETPSCPHCQLVMTFVGQIDSIEQDEKHNPHRVDCMGDQQDYMFGDVGMLYVFFCFDCCHPEVVFQCG